MKKSKKKEMIAPIVITILMFLYYALYFLVLYSLCSELPNPILWKIFFAIIPLISGFFLMALLYLYVVKKIPFFSVDFIDK